MSALAREVGGSQALAWLLLLIMGMFAYGDQSRSSDIECLRSIKESLQDPQGELANWVFDNSTESDDYICSFKGVECWNRGSEHMIMKIILSGLGLRGEFPRGIAYCKSLTGLDLSSNHLYGFIPSNISELIGYVILLDLSYNGFSGEIPPTIANCKYLNFLKLDNNLLTGQIPAQLGSLNRLQYFDVANNNLSGPVPIFVNASFPPEMYANNTGLCGDPLAPCKPQKVQQNLFVDGFLAGWGISVTLFLAVGLFTPFWEYMIKFVKKKQMAIPRLHSLPLSQRMHNTLISRLEKFAPRMSLLELRQATDNFSEKNVIAIGEMGTIYKAILSNGYCLAIKRLTTAPHIEHEFQQEIMTLGRLRHRNLVPLLGFCHESDERFLIYKFMANGSLHDCLFLSEGESRIMEWHARVKIAVGIAKGIAWLHLNGVIHHGISSKCILLDKDLSPRISNFGKATTVNHNNTSSDLSFNGEFSVLCSYEEDVKAFGKVLLELITGTKYNEIIRSFDIDADMFERISHLLDETGPSGACVQSMMEQGFGDEISRFLRVASKCLECGPGNWPSMQEVCQMLIGKRRDDKPVDGSDTLLKSEIEFADVQNN